MAQSVDSSWKRLYKAGGISFILAGVLYFVALSSFFTGPNAFGLGGEATLKLIASNRSGYLLGEGLFAFSSLFLVPGLLALYTLLKDLDKSYALLGTGLLLFSLTGLVLGPGTGALVNLTDKYAAATTDAQRAAFSAAAEAVTSLSTAFTVGPLMAGAGLIFVSVVMLKGIFHKGVAYLGVATGVSLLLAGAGLGFFFIIFAVLSAVFSLAVGSKLYRLG